VKHNAQKKPSQCRTGDGYRYDHVSKDLITELTHCEYIHELRLTRSGATPLLTSDPVEAARQPTLF
jgi:hypothetical protein